MAANLTVAKNNVIRRLSDKIEEGKNINRQLVSGISVSEYEKLFKDEELWEESVTKILTQVFTDERISKEFSDSKEYSILENAELSKKIDVVKKEVNEKLRRLDRIVKDVKDNLYQLQFNSQITAKWSFWQTIIVSLITAIGGVIAGYIASAHKTTPLELQGLSTLTLEGRWKYICTSFDGTYQHGGRLTVQKQSDGSLSLDGERMWKDTQDTLKHVWTYNNFAPGNYLDWDSDWILVRNNTSINFEYKIQMQDKEVIGYCSGTIYSKKDTALEIKGHFYVVNQKPILNGQIVFKRVSEKEYATTKTLPKNH